MFGSFQSRVKVEQLCSWFPPASLEQGCFWTISGLHVWTTESFSSIYFLCISKLIFSVYVETVFCLLSSNIRAALGNKWWWTFFSLLFLSNPCRGNLITTTNALIILKCQFLTFCIHLWEAAQNLNKTDAVFVCFGFFCHVKNQLMIKCPVYTNCVI